MFKRSTGVWLLQPNIVEGIFQSKYGCPSYQHSSVQNATEMWDNRVLYGDVPSMLTLKVFSTRIILRRFGKTWNKYHLYISSHIPIVHLRWSCCIAVMQGLNALVGGNGMFISRHCLSQVTYPTFCYPCLQRHTPKPNYSPKLKNISLIELHIALG